MYIRALCGNCGRDTRSSDNSCADRSTLGGRGKRVSFKRYKCLYRLYRKHGETLFDSNFSGRTNQSPTILDCGHGNFSAEHKSAGAHLALAVLRPVAHDRLTLTHRIVFRSSSAESNSYAESNLSPVILLFVLLDVITSLDIQHHHHQGIPEPYPTLPQSISPGASDGQSYNKP